MLIILSLITLFFSCITYSSDEEIIPFKPWSSTISEGFCLEWQPFPTSIHFQKLQEEEALRQSEEQVRKNEERLQRILRPEGFDEDEIRNRAFHVAQNASKKREKQERNRIAEEEALSQSERQVHENEERLQRILRPEGLDEDEIRNQALHVAQVVSKKREQREKDRIAEEELVRQYIFEDIIEKRKEEICTDLEALRRGNKTSSFVQRRNKEASLKKEKKEQSCRAIEKTTFRGVEKEEEIDFKAYYEKYCGCYKLIEVQEAIDYLLQHNQHDYALKLLRPHYERKFPPACYQAACIISNGANGVNQDPKKVYDLYSHVLGIHDKKIRVDAASHLLMLSAILNINGIYRDRQKEEAALRIVYSSNPAIEKCYIAMQALHSAQEKIFGFKAKQFSHTLSRLSNTFNEIIQKYPMHSIVPLCHMQIAHIISLQALTNKENSVSIEQCDCMQDHIDRMLKGVNDKKNKIMALYNTECLQKAAADNYFALATQYECPEDQQRVMLKAANLDHPCANICVAYDFLDQQNIKEAKKHFNKVLACPCMSYIKIFSWIELARIAQEEQGYIQAIEYGEKAFKALKDVEKKATGKRGIIQLNSCGQCEDGLLCYDPDALVNVKDLQVECKKMVDECRECI